jgi:Ca2+-binding RTX toxin-like protein
MTTLQQYNDYSQLSMAAYSTALNSTVNGSLAFEDALQNTSSGFTQAQAHQLVQDGWEVIDQSKDSLYGDSGFSATLFHNTKTGEYVFANRGTAGVQDLFTDGWGIALLGTAGSQTIDMYRYYKQLITPAGLAVSYTADEIERLHAIGGIYAPVKFLLTSQVESYLSGDLGIGKMSPTQTFATTGHSLGGHLALWLNALAPSAVSHVYTYNGAGLGGEFPSLLSIINGVITGTPQMSVVDAKVTNLYGYGGPAIISGVGGSVGQNIPVDIEFKDPLSSALSGLYNHSIVQLTDTIAVANIFAKLDSNITFAQYNDYFLKSSNEIGKSLEGALDGLRKFFGLTDTTLNDNRFQFYSNLYALQNSDTFKALAGHVTLTATPTSSSEARTDFSAFLSLFYLTPFALKTDSLAAENTLKNANSALRYEWEADNNLNPEQRANGGAVYSDMYLADRAAMLSWINKRNNTDNTNLILDGGTTQQSFIDYATDTIIHTGGTLYTGGIGRNQYIFGDSNGNPISGYDKDDHIYGGAGNDTISGGNGHNYLEGGADDDLLYGGNDSDILMGGTGEDTLTGGSGNDYLYGGTGTDTYIHNTGDGNDVITDSDGDGKILINGNTNPLTGGKQVKGTTNLWQSDGKLTQYALYHNGDGTDTLNIYLNNNERLFVKNWQDGNLGISLKDNKTSTPTVKTNQSDFYVAQNADELIDGGAGNDFIAAGIGADYVHENASDDGQWRIAA